MRYTIEWAPPAEAELAGIWLAVADQAAVTTAVAILEQRLERQLLSVDFTVIEDDKKVIVLAV